MKKILLILMLFVTITASSQVSIRENTVFVKIDSNTYVFDCDDLNDISTEQLRYEYFLVERKYPYANIHQYKQLSGEYLVISDSELLLCKIQRRKFKLLFRKTYEE